ncbi:uncharacterized protein LOC589345 isoform X2 [Strongylocentrotus purpuratus]|uniref:Uncharacterized protein n=1 Tax=Strongylocentrotus purpuratus TaxID=7668 RepID=A0A7M7T1A7_STRPU|nr:uncharacterized protein LOC589345 isoform X2 [Strongylocentrotus purpuratus]
MSTQEQLCDFKKSDSDTSVRSTTELEEAGRMLLNDLDDDGEKEIFFGPMTDREKLKSKKMRRKTKVFKPGFRVDCDEEEEEPAGELQGTEIKEGDLEEDSNPGTGLSTWHTPSPTQKRLRSSESAINVNAPPFSLVTVSPQADAAAVSEHYGSCGVELFSATDSVTGCDATCVETGIDGSSRDETKTTDSVTGQISEAQSPTLSSTETVPPAVAKPTPSKTTGHCGQSTVIYSSPLLISTTVQRVQMQQPICYGNDSSLIHVPAADVVRRDNSEMGTDVAHQTDPSSSKERNVASSAFFPTGHTAFGKPTRKIDDLAASQNLLPTPSAVYQSPSSNARYFNQATNNDQGLCTLPPSMLHKENVNPDRQPNAVLVASDSAVKYQVLSSVSSPIVSALCSKQPSHYPSGDAQQAPSPRVLQLSNRQASAGSPSADARQRLIDEKRALLARLRAEKQELRQRIKEDNEKTERELEVVTKLHTIRNSQHTASDRTQSPCHQAICHRDQSRLHWREDLIQSIEELSSPSRPRCKARTILSKKGDNLVRRGAGLQPSSSSSSPHSGQPRAKQHLLF